MNYQKIYDALVEKAKVRGLDKSQHEGYFEIHHIVPRCLGGSDEDSNLVMFTAREHYLAHMLLWKAYPEEVNLMRAAFLMSNRKISKINARVYEALRWNISEVSKETNSGENNPFFGKKHTEETKAKFKLRKIRKGSENPAYGVKWSEERKLKFSESRKGIPWSQAQRDSAVFHTGEDHHFFGKSHSEETRQKISEILKAKNQRPWQNLSTQTEESLLKWTMCDYYYDLWIKFDKPGLKRFTKIYNEIHNDDVSLAFFTNPRLHFLDGWIPANDEEWLEFREEFYG